MGSSGFHVPRVLREALLRQLIEKGPQREHELRPVAAATFPGLTSQTFDMTLKHLKRAGVIEKVLIERRETKKGNFARLNGWRITAIAEAELAERDRIHAAVGPVRSDDSKVRKPELVVAGRRWVK